MKAMEKLRQTAAHPETGGLITGLGLAGLIDGWLRSGSSIEMAVGIAVMTAGLAMSTYAVRVMRQGGREKK